MTREQAKELLPIIQAYAEGKDIQWRNHCKNWIDIDERDGLITEFPLSVYRIKPDPKYRPFKNKEECWKEMNKHQPFGWIISETKYHLISSLSDIYVWIGDNTYFTFEEEFNEYKFADGTPFGIKEK